MLIKKFNPYIKDKDSYLENEILNIEFSKNGLNKFHENHKDLYLIVTLMDGITSTDFDKSGTYPSCSEEFVTYDPTGAYKNNRKGRKVSPDRIVRVLADVENVFDFINFFEANLDTEKLIN